MRILVVGAGIGGLTLAGLLAQRGVRPVVIDRAKAWGRVGYVLALWSNGIRALRPLGLGPRLMERGRVVTEYAIGAPDGRIVRTMHLGPLNRKHGPIVQLHRAALHEALLEAVVERGVTVQLQTTVTSLRQQPDAVEVQFSDGTGDTFDLVVGADGIHSQIRGLLFGPGGDRYFGSTGWAFIVPPGLSVPAGITELWGHRRYFGFYPYRQDQCGVYCTMRSPQGVEIPSERSIDVIRSHFRGFGGMVPAILAALDHPEEVFHDDVHEIRLRHWSQGRVVLLGDAAHAMPPFGGMGGSMAMEDAFVLTEELSRFDPGRIPLALACYQRRRQKRVASVQRYSRIKGLTMIMRSIIPLSLRAMYAIGPDPMTWFGSRAPLVWQERFLDWFLSDPI